jgi:hypothetical protein
MKTISELQNEYNKMIQKQLNKKLSFKVNKKELVTQCLKLEVY